MSSDSASILGSERNPSTSHSSVSVPVSTPVSSSLSLSSSVSSSVPAPSFTPTSVPASYSTGFGNATNSVAPVDLSSASASDASRPTQHRSPRRSNQVGPDQTDPSQSPSSPETPSNWVLTNIFTTWDYQSVIQFLDSHCPSSESGKVNFIVKDGQSEANDRWLCLMVRDLFLALQDAGFDKRNNSNLRVLPFSLKYYHYPRRNESKSLYIRLPLTEQASACNDQVVSFLKPIIECGLFGTTDYRLKIPRILTRPTRVWASSASDQLCH